MSALARLLKDELPSTWNWLLPVAVTAGAVTPPSAPAKVWRFAPVATAVVVAAAAAAVCEIYDQGM